MRKLKLVVLVLLILLSTSAIASQPKIYLAGGEIAPEASQQSRGLTTQSLNQQPSYKLLQFKQPTTKEQREELEGLGVEYISYIPDNAWIIRFSGQRNEIVREEKVHYLGAYRPGYRIEPQLKKEAARNSGEVQIRVEMFESEGAEELLDSYGEVKDKYGSDKWKLETSYENISEISQKEEVRWIAQEIPDARTFNAESRALIGVNTVQDPLKYNLTGDGFTAAIWDGGPDGDGTSSGGWAGDHEDLNYTGKRVIGDKGEDCGACEVKQHPTHVAGTMLGGGILDNSLRGMAPDARLATYGWPSNSGSYSFWEEIEVETNDSINSYDSVLSQNSWGYGGESEFGIYDSVTETYDSITSGENPNVDGTLSMIFSAGNNRNNVAYDYNTTSPPSTSKNTITVGAVDDTGDMTSYSSWGPTDDGRIKPTLVADGGCGDNTAIESTLPGNVYDDTTSSGNGWCGTSMAAPAVSGTAILLNQRFDQTYERLPEPATVKASLIHTAEDLGREGPDYKFGWGLVNATSAIDYVDDSKGKDLIKRGSLNQDETDSFDVTVPKRESVKFTLVWSDYPGSYESGKALINDLDLIVENGEGERKYPYSLSWEGRKEPALQTQEDHTNPVEQVEISNTGSNSYNVAVEGYDVPEGPQDYSLLITSNSLDPVSPDLTVKSPLNDTYRQTPDFNLSSNQSLSNANFSVNGKGNFSMLGKNETYFYNATATVEQGQHEARFWGENTLGNLSSETVHFTLDSENPSLDPLKPVDNANISGIFSIDASWSDGTTDIVKSNYTLSNSTFIKEGLLNSSLNSSEFEDGRYNITYNVTDSAGNSNTSKRQVTFDNSRPQLSSYSPEEGEGFGDNFSINGSGLDNVTGVRSSTFELENGSVQLQGDLNATVDVSSLESGKYNISYLLEDYAGNSLDKTVEILIDTENPSLTPFRPENQSYVKENFTVSAVFDDSYSGLKDADYTVSNDSVQLEGELNGTLDTSDLLESDYDIEYVVEDNLGNKNTSNLDVTFDRTSPDLNLTSPSENEVLAGKFSLNASYSDEVSDDIGPARYTLENDSVQKEGDFNATIESSEFADGDYNVTANVSDKAGNINFTYNSIRIDNTAPELKKSSIVDGDNVSGLQDINVSFDEVSELDKTDFKWYNSSGNVTGWNDLNYTGFDTSELSDGEYNIAVRANDSLGNLDSTNITGVTVDNTDPELSLTGYDLNSEYNGWINNSKTVETRCKDNSAVKHVSVGDQVNSTVPGNLTVSDTGNNTYTFTCRDYAGNTDSEKRNYAIDSQRPEITAIDPDNSSEVDRSFSHTLDFNDEDQESGLNLSSSYVSLSSGGGKIISREWANSTLSLELEGFDYSESLEIGGRLVDNLGHVESFNLDYTTVSKPEPDSEPDSGGSSPSGPTGPASLSSSEDSEVSEVEELFEQTDRGLEVSNLELSNGEKRKLSVMDYSNDTISEFLIRANGSGRVNLSFERIKSVAVPSRFEANRFFRIELSNQSMVENMSVIFDVERSWAEDRSLDDLGLYRIIESWESLETHLMEDKSQNVKYRSELDSLSDFAVAVERECGSGTIYAVDPSGESCNSFESSCEVPDGWENVESCSVWEERKQAEGVIQNLTERGVDEEKLREVQERYEQGDYSGALDLAESIEKKEQDQGLETYIVILAVFVLGMAIMASSYLLYGFYSKRKLENEIESLGEDLMSWNDELDSEDYQEIANKVIRAQKSLDMGDRKQATEILDEARDRMMEKSLLSEEEGSKHKGILYIFFNWLKALR